MWESGDITTLHTAYLFHMKNNPYTYYYLDQQGHGMPVFRGSPWEMEHSQKGYGLGALFRSVTRSVMPLVKRGAKALGNIVLNTGANFVSVILARKNVNQAAKARAVEGVNAARTKVAQQLQRYAQTGQGRKWSRSIRRPAKKRKATASASRCPAKRTTRKRKTPPTKRKAKKRKASVSMTRRKQTKRLRNSA